ncbi:Superkiller protein 3 [Knufia peltigerae]|uniref:Superkiller protein 3 n=1 Tax=Knufia peltigerae TaxID=1002370 RepID=A0AA39D2A4_9EURO|nr:Superkiller protein 3 [Knufia peltigerae]
MATKGLLKAIKASLDNGQFEKAAQQAEDVVSQDNKNHTALLFLGFAREKLNDLDAAEKAIRKAADLKSQDPQAYKGLITLFEKQGSSKVDAYHGVAFKLAEIYAEQEDRAQCQNVIDKYELFAKKHGSRAQYRRALELILPTSSLYSVLEGRVMQPSLTYQRILESAEAEEKEWINTQIGERRTRLGARIDQVTKQVKAEAIDRFHVEDIYAALIDWTRDDDARHDLEQKLFRRLYDDLRVVPEQNKAQQRDKVLTMGNGMVIVKQPFLLAWRVALEWVDAEELEDWDVHIFREYVDFFPDDGLSKILGGFLNSDISPFPRPPVDPSEESEKDEKDEKLNGADLLILLNEGLEDCPDSLLAHRILSYTYLRFEDWEGTVSVARKAQSLVKDAQKLFALELQNTLDGVNLILAKAMIEYQSPRYHPEAKSLFEEILQRKPKLTPALLGIGLIFEEDEDYPQAVRFLQQASERDPDNVRIKLEYAWCRAQDGAVEDGLRDLQHILSDIEAERHQDLSVKSIVLYRIAWCQWHSNSSAKARKDKSGPYKHLIASIKANPSYAPAYTLLGTYFQHYGKSKQRARVALQKAFELSTSELDAAHRLAKAFADAAEWDLVELVAQRVVASGKAKPAPGSKKRAYSWPFAALGVVQMNKQQYFPAIVSFQAALRINATDYYSWVGLGESYHNAGRHIAATRAFAKAQSLDHGLSADETWFAEYMLANVQREMGLFDEAILAYRAVLDMKPDEFGVLLALLQTMSENASAKVGLGMFGEAVKLAASAIEVATDIAQRDTNSFNLWKAAGDACSVLGQVRLYSDPVNLQSITSLLRLSLGNELDILVDLDKVDLDTTAMNEHHSQLALSDKFLHAAILAHKRAVYASSTDQHAQAVAWYNLGWAEFEAYSFSPAPTEARGKKYRRFLKAAIKCFKRAIELEASNSEFWNALGVVTLDLSPQVSQHAFVRSLHLNDHSSRTWTNLGVLYIVHGDNQLANEAFTRAQSEDPEYADAWIGQGLLALLFGSVGEARGLFTHAFDIADASRLPAKRHYAISAFDYLLKDPSRSQEVSHLLQPLFAMRQYHVHQPSDMVSTHLMALLAERAGDCESSSEALREVCDAAEAEYEKSESTEYLVRFTQAKADLSRAQLACGEFSDAVASAETALDLSGDADDFGATYSEARQRWRLAAQVTAGLAHSHLHNTEQSIKMFQEALGEVKNEPDIVCMLAQVLWAKGGEAEKEAAQSQLFGVVANNPKHVQAVCLLAVMGLLDDDEAVLEAVEEELKALRSTDDVGILDKIRVTQVLAGIAGCKVKKGPRHRDEEAETPMATLADALEGIMLAPGQPQGWSELSQSVQDEEDEGAGVYAAEMAVLNANRQVPPGGKLEADDLAMAYQGTGQVEDLLRAKMLAPWRVSEHMTLECTVF